MVVVGCSPRAQLPVPTILVLTEPPWASWMGALAPCGAQYLGFQAIQSMAFHGFSSLRDSGPPQSPLPDGPSGLSPML